MMNPGGIESRGEVDLSGCQRHCSGLPAIFCLPVRFFLIHPMVAVSGELFFPERRAGLEDAHQELAGGEGRRLDGVDKGLVEWQGPLTNRNYPEDFKEL